MLLVSSDDKTFKSREDFSAVDDYARYVRDNISMGMIVRCCEGYEEVRLGDTGRVMKVGVVRIIGNLSLCSC